MRLSSALQSFLLLLTALLLVVNQARALEDSQQAALQGSTDSGSADDTPVNTIINHNNDKDHDKPKLFKPRTGIMKEEHDVDPGNQRARADEVILENADEDEDSERTIESLEDLSADELLAMLRAAYRHDEL